MSGPIHILRRSPIARLGLICALVYLPVALGLTINLIDAIRGAVVHRLHYRGGPA